MCVAHSWSVRASGFTNKYTRMAALISRMLNLSANSLAVRSEGSIIASVRTFLALHAFGSVTLPMPCIVGNDR